MDVLKVKVGNEWVGIPAIASPTPPVTDVQVNGSSVVSNGVAEVPVANATTFGVAKVSSNLGVNINPEGFLTIGAATSSTIKNANTSLYPIAPVKQHEAVFYGLTKAAGVDMASSDNAVGTYTDAAKTAIRAMIGAGAPIDVQVNGTSVLNNGVANIPFASGSRLGVIKTGTGNGIYVDSTNGEAYVSHATDEQVKSSNGAYRPISPNIQHASVFYGLAKAAGDSTQAASSNAVGTYTNDAKSAIRTMIGAGTYSKPANGIPASDLASGVIPSVPVTDVQVNGTSVLNNGVANIPMANGTTPGVITISPSVSATGLIDDVDLAGNSYLKIYAAPVQIIKLGSNECMPITSLHQHESVFYGLAKAAGEDMASSSNAVGTYTDAAKSAIRTMIGAGTSSISDIQVNGTSVLSSGVANIPFGTQNRLGVVKGKIAYGTDIDDETGEIAILRATNTDIKTGTQQFRPVTPYDLDSAVFYGLARAAGDATQAAETGITTGTYTAAAKTAIKSMLGVTDLPAVTAADNGKVLMVVNGAWAVVSLSSANGVSF